MISLPYCKQLRGNHRAEQQNQQAQRHQSACGNVVASENLFPTESRHKQAEQDLKRNGQHQQHQPDQQQYVTPPDDSPPIIGL